jgi:hypothetical protein
MGQPPAGNHKTTSGQYGGNIKQLQGNLRVTSGQQQGNHWATRGNLRETAWKFWGNLGSISGNLGEPGSNHFEDFDLTLYVEIFQSCLAKIVCDQKNKNRT